VREDLLNLIYQHAEEEAPRECCGLVVEEEGKMEYIKMQNKANSDDEFLMDSQLFTLFNLTKKILYVVHSHYNLSCKPSKYDEKNCKAMDIPYLIVSYPEKDYCIVTP
jgi:proteasome lid subunit RPN8/RPN11